MDIPTRQLVDFLSTPRQPLARVNCFIFSHSLLELLNRNTLPKEIVDEQDFSIFQSKLRKYFFFSQFLIILKFSIVLKYIL